MEGDQILSDHKSKGIQCTVIEDMLAEKVLYLISGPYSIQCHDRKQQLLQWYSKLFNYSLSCQIGSVEYSKGEQDDGGVIWDFLITKHWFSSTVWCINAWSETNYKLLRK